MEYLFVPNLTEYGQVPEKSILSSTLHNDDRTKVILFRFAEGQELSAHTAPFPAMIQFISGEATLRLGEDRHDAISGTFAYMPAQLEHGIKAKTETVMLLTLLKNAT